MKIRNPRNSGSVLITSVIFGFALFVAVAAYVYLTTQSLRMANRTFHLNSAMNLAEAGIEEGLAVINTYKPYGFSAPVASAYNNWTTGDFDGDGVEDAKRTFQNDSSGNPYFKSNQGSVGEFTVIISNRLLANEETNPAKLIVRARSSVANEAVIEKYVRAKTGRRSLNSNALVARRGIRFDGQFAAVDSYDSNFGPYEYDTGAVGVKEDSENVTGPNGVPDFDASGAHIVNRFGNAIVASTSVGVNLGNADVWGYVATSGTSPNLGPNGSIADLGYAQGTVDPERISSDFQASFPQLPIPTSSSPFTAFPAATANPITGDPEILIGTTSNDTGIPEVYAITGNYSLSGGTSMRIVGPVRIVISGDFRANAASNEVIIDNSDYDGDGTPNFANVFANAMMTKLDDDTVPPVQIWIGGDLNLGSGGLTNPFTTPASFQIYGTAPVPSGSSGTQSITLAGGSANSWWAAAVYAPNADLVINGDKDVFGAFVANSIRVMGSSKFHYDESLAVHGTGQYGIETWRELITPAQRAGYTW